METRTHKLLVLAGQEGVELEIRDFKKLSQVIVNEYLSEPNQSYRNFLVDILAKVVRGIPLKSHLYAGLTVAVAKGYPQLAAKILETVVLGLQSDLGAGYFRQGLNALNYLSETMNVSFLNSLNFMNLLQDLLLAGEKETDPGVKRSLLGLLVKGLPFYANSLHEKTYHQFKKFMEKLFKLTQGDDLCAFFYGQFTQGRIGVFSAMGRLGFDFGAVAQHQGKLRLHLELKAAREREQGQTDIGQRWEFPAGEIQYEAYRRGEGLVLRMWLDHIIEAFSSNNTVLTLKIVNLALWKSENIYQIRFLVDSLILRALRSRNSITEYFLLGHIRNSQQLDKHSKMVDPLLYEYFSAAEGFELSVIVSFAKLFGYVMTNSKEEVDWSRYSEGEEQFHKRSALLRLIIQKIGLLNDKFKCPVNLQAYDCVKPVTNEQQFTTAADKEGFEQMDKALKSKAQAVVVGEMIKSERDYELFLEALFRRTSLSQTHLNILQGRYHQILTRFSQWDWDLINRIRNFFRNSFFHRLLYLRFMITRKVLSFASYINYVGGLKNKSELEMLWIKMELNELNSEFGKQLKLSK